jgi:hypothetical protein
LQDRDVSLLSQKPFPHRGPGVGETADGTTPLHPERLAIRIDEVNRVRVNERIREGFISSSNIIVARPKTLLKGFQESLRE